MNTETPRDDERCIKQELDHLRTQLAALNAPAKIETALLAKFATNQRKSAAWPQQLGQWLAPGGAIAASTFAALWLLIGAPPMLSSSLPPIGGSSNDYAMPFVAVQTLEQIALEPNPRVIETMVPKVMLTSMGVAVAPEYVGDTVRAEMLVSAGGQPLAVRFRAN